MDFLDDLFIIKSTEETETGFVARLCCNPAHPVYRAHFPGNPITPGACLLKTAGEVLQQKTGHPLYLKSSKNIKYLSLLVPEAGKEVRFEFSNFTEIENGCKAQLVIADETSVYSKMSLTFSYEPL
ncbi:MAG: beta-hydroxyacyl-ACP dehydratase [Bacteroidales bacterium]|nr:beta-hydroxyacyl-ACP dehydratase [Bacteroidales bacterium]